MTGTAEDGLGKLEEEMTFLEECEERYIWLDRVKIWEKGQGGELRHSL